MQSAAAFLYMVTAFSIDWTSPAVLASFIAALIATLGLVVVRFNSRFADRYSGYFSAFAAGVLVMTAFRLFPEGLSLTPNAPYWTLGGYLLLFMLNAILRHDPTTTVAVLPPLFGIALHSFIDGIEYGVLFDYDLYIGLMASAGLILHEFAEGMILFVLLRAGGVKPGFAIILAFFGAALTTPLGAILSVEYLDRAPDELLGILVSIAAGTLLYVGATHLTVHITNTNRFVAVLWYLIGVTLALGMSFLHHDMHDVSDGHGDHDDHEQEIVQPLPRTR